MFQLNFLESRLDVLEKEKESVKQNVISPRNKEKKGAPKKR